MCLHFSPYRTDNPRADRTNLGLNEDIFPLGTNTYPVTRNIRVELAVTVIVAILGVISQLRLWKIIREKRRKDEEVRLEEQKRDEESEAETARHLEEKNIRERNEWETKYGDPNSVTELPDDEEKFHESAQLAKGEVQSITSSSSSEKSHRCSDCRERAENGESAYASSDSSSSSSGSMRPSSSAVSMDENDTPHVKVFDGAAASKIKNDRASEVTAVLGSETATIRSKRFSGKSFKSLRRMSVMSRSSMGQISQSQEALLPRDDGSSVQGIADEASDANSEVPTMGARDLGETKDALEADRDGSSVYSKEPDAVGSAETERSPKDAAGEGGRADTPKDISKEASREGEAERSSNIAPDTVPQPLSKEQQTPPDDRPVAVEEGEATLSKSAKGKAKEETAEPEYLDKHDKGQEEDPASEGVKQEDTEQAMLSAPIETKAKSKRGSPKESKKKSKRDSKKASRKVPDSGSKDSNLKSKNEDEDEARVESSNASKEEVGKSTKPSKETKQASDGLKEPKEEPMETFDGSKISKKKSKKAKKQSRAEPSLQSTPNARSEDKVSSEDSPAEKNKAAEDGTSSSGDNPSHVSSDAEIPAPLKPRKTSSSKVKSSENPQPSLSNPKITSKQKKEKPQAPPKLDTQTVDRLPQRSSRVVQCYRTNEWAKHLADAEAPEPEPIEPVHEDDPDTPDDPGEAPAPVHVEELLQTPLNAQPPPAVEPRSSLAREPPNANESPRRSSDFHRHSSTKKQRASGVTFMPTTHLTQVPVPQPPLVQTMAADEPMLHAASPPAEPLKEDQPAKPQWKGPPPLIAVREGMMRNRLSSFSLHVDPWPSRNSPGQSPIVETPPLPPPPPVRHSSTAYPPIPEEADDLPLSQRRTMLHQRTSVVNPLINPFVNVPYQPQPRRSSQNSGILPENQPAAMAAFRESVREDLHDKHAPLKIMSPKGPSDRNAPPPLGQSLRNASSQSIGSMAGDMSDLHREAMRRMQAQANRNVNGM